MRTYLLPYPRSPIIHSSLPPLGRRSRCYKVKESYVLCGGVAFKSLCSFWRRRKPAYLSYSWNLYRYNEADAGGGLGTLRRVPFSECTRNPPLLLVSNSFLMRNCSFSILKKMAPFHDFRNWRELE